MHSVLLDMLGICENVFVVSMSSMEGEMCIASGKRKRWKGWAETKTQDERLMSAERVSLMGIGLIRKTCGFD
jgi:hypothetical protein